jgi:hypothetical protein
MRQYESVDGVTVATVVRVIFVVLPVARPATKVTASKMTMVNVTRARRSPCEMCAAAVVGLGMVLVVICFSLSASPGQQPDSTDPPPWRGVTSNRTDGRLGRRSSM